MLSVKSALFWNSLQQVGRLGLSFIATIILARILTPKDYGIYAVLMIFISIGETISDSGIGGYLIKKKDVTKEDYNTLFVYNLVISVLLYIILYFSAPFIGKLYDYSNIESAIQILGVVIVIQAFSITQLTKLLKNLKFKILAIISLVSGSTSLILAIVLAHKEYGFWALIWQQVYSTLFTTILYIIVNKNIPKFRFDFTRFKEQWSFGYNLMLSTILNSIKLNILNNIIGKVVSLRGAGIYNQANRLQNYPLVMMRNVIDKTFFPIFSTINDQKELLLKEYDELCKQLYAFMFPIFSIIICYSKEIIIVFLGSEWIESIPILQILMFSSFPILVVALNRNLFKSMGNTRIIFIIEICSLIFLTIGVGTNILVKGGIIGFSLCVVVYQYLTMIVSMYKIKDSTAFPLRVQLKNIALFIPMALIPFIGIAISENLITKTVIIVIGVGISAVIYTFLGYKQYKNLIRLIKR